MGKLWDEFKKNLYYEEPQVQIGTHKKTNKELQKEKEESENKINTLRTERKNLLNSKGIDTTDKGNPLLINRYTPNQLTIGTKYKQESNTSNFENYQKEVKNDKELSENLNKNTKQLYKELTNKSLINQEINTRKAEKQAEESGTVSKILTSPIIGAWNKFSNFMNDDLIYDENGKVYKTKTYGELLNEANRSKLTGASGFLYDVGNLAGETATQFIPVVGQANYFTDIAMDKYNDNLRNGVNANDALINAVGVSLVDFAKQKLLGALGSKATTGKLNGGGLESAMEKGLGKVFTNSSINKILAGTSAEFLDEFTDSIVEQVWDNVTINKNGVFEGMDDPEFWKQAVYEGLLGAVTGGAGSMINVATTPKSQRIAENSILQYQKETGNQISENNKTLLNNISSLYEMEGKKYTEQDVIDRFVETKNKQISDFTNDAINKFTNLDEEHQVKYNQLVNDVAQIIYDTGVIVKFDPNQNTVVNTDNGIITLNPTRTDMPIKNILLHEMAKNMVSKDTKNYVINKLKKDGTYENIKQELLATGEFDESNVDVEIVAQELDNIFSDENKLKELQDFNVNSYATLFEEIQGLASKLTNNRNTKDALYLMQLYDRFQKDYGTKVETTAQKDYVKENKKEEQKTEKEQQFEIIQKTNPAPNDTNTWIRSKEDISTFKEAYDTAKSEAEDGGWENYASYPDITNDIVDKALETGKITVYSSYPIENGVFVTPSYQQALDYAGSDASKVNSKEVNLNDVAWINLDEGQYAKVENEVKNEYRSTEKLPENVSEGTYIEPSTPIKESKKNQKYIKTLTGESKVRSQLSKDYTSIVDKLHPIAILAKLTGNKELYAKYNNRGMSNGMGQYQVGTAQTDINGNKIGKSINDIWKPVENAKLTNEFDDYLAHRLNEERYDKVPVWDESVTPEMSREVINDYESKYPQFKEWAQDVYKFNDNQLQKMIDAGLSKENARDWLYSQYVTIARDIGPKTNPLVQNAKGVKVNSPIRKAKGGNQEIRPMKESMARQTLLTERAIADNIAGQELLNVLGGTVGDTKTFLTQDLEGNNNALIQNEDGTYNYTVYKNGIPVTMQITKEIADAIRPTKIGEWENLGAFKALRKASEWQKSWLTDRNPWFILTNFYKDLGDAPLNSKYGAQLYAKYPEAVYKMVTNSKEWQQYVAKGGKSNSYFNTGTGEFEKSKNKLIRGIQILNGYVEQAPRFTEYLLTLEHGGTIDEALYNSAEVTTNFARGGEITKALNRNGATFLNASVQGFDKQIRNFTGQNGAKGYVNLLAKVMILGVAPAMLNHILLEDDDDYEELPDYIKDNYYLFKTGDNKFIRIPKGRAMSIFGDVARHSYEAYKGNETLLEGLKDTGEQFVNNVAPNNPLENNVLAPLIAVANNKSWNGSAIVSTRLQKLPENQQYDEKTSSIGKWLGQTFNYSPKKVDYLLDQYTGAIGDIVLPATTPQAESESKNPLVSALKNKFTTDSTISSKYVSEFYDTKEKLEKEQYNYSSIDESEESFQKSLQYKYLSAVNEEVAELYNKKREIQNSNLDDKEKYQQARAVQRQIDDITKFALQDYTTGYYTDSYAVVGDKEFYTTMSNGKLVWSKVSADTKEKQEKYAEKYDISPEGYYEMKPLSQSVSAGSVNNYAKINKEITDIRKKTNKDKEATIDYVNKLDLSIPQKAMLIRMQGYTSYNDYNDEIFNYINSLDMIEEQKQEILIYLGFEYNKNTKQFSWK